MKAERRTVIEHMMAKGKRALKSAGEHIKQGDYDFASSKAYYAVFHFMQAALATEELTFSKHSAVIAEFNRNFIRSGIFPKDFSKNIERLFKQRQIGDYDYSPVIDKEEAGKDLAIAKLICDKVEEYLRKEILPK